MQDTQKILRQIHDLTQRMDAYSALSPFRKARHFTLNPSFQYQVIAPQEFMHACTRRIDLYPYYHHPDSPKQESISVKADRLAIVVPQTNRSVDITPLLTQLKQIFVTERTQGSFAAVRVFVIQQQENLPINRGKLSNIGYELAIRADYTRILFHDQDLLPESVSYLPEENNPLVSALADESGILPPFHIASCLERYDRELPFPWYSGGAILFDAQQFRLINGYSNRYWGGLGEDDDLAIRIHRRWKNGMDRRRPFCSHGKFTDAMSTQRILEETVRYDGMSPSNCIYQSSGQFQATIQLLDGLNSLCYKVLTVTESSDAFSCTYFVEV